MLAQILTLTEQPKYYDATDAIAVALCHHFQCSSPVAKLAGGLNGWEDFIKRNPNRISVK